MPANSPPFAIVHAPGPAGAVVVVRAGLHADEVSVALADERQRLRAAGGTGDLIVVRTDTSTITLREAINGTVDGHD